MAKCLKGTLVFFHPCCISGYGELDTATFSSSGLSASEGCLRIGKPSFSFAACARLSARSILECKEKAEEAHLTCI